MASQQPNINKNTVDSNHSFTAIDFETAHGKRWSICQVGIVKVKHGEITDEVTLLVQPPNNYYWGNFTRIHGIGPKDTRYTQTFDEIWDQIASFISGQNLVAHNGFSFDFHCLKQTLEFYKMPVPAFTGHCTYKIYGDNLASLCMKHHILLNHHDALSDALACAKLYIMHLNTINGNEY